MLLGSQTHLIVTSQPEIRISGATNFFVYNSCINNIPEVRTIEEILNIKNSRFGKNQFTLNIKAIFFMIVPLSFFISLRLLQSHHTRQQERPPA